MPLNEGFDALGASGLAVQSNAGNPCRLAQRNLRPILAILCSLRAIIRRAMASQFQHLRARYFDADPARARALRQYHLREREVAGLIATETRHPRHFRIPAHSHELHSFYVVLDGALTEFSRNSEWSLDGYSVVFTPAGHVHHNTFHGEGGRCFLVEFTTAWIERLNTPGLALDRPRVVASTDVALLSRKLYRQFRDPEPGWPLLVEGLPRDSRRLRTRIAQLRRRRGSELARTGARSVT
jgi:hypothetical protein